MAGIGRFFVVFYKALEQIAIAGLLLTKCRQRRLALCRDAIAPALRLFEGGLGLLIGLPKLSQSRTDGLRVNLSHDFANQLFLSAQCAVRTYSFRLANLLDQVIVGLDAGEFFIANRLRRPDKETVEEPEETAEAA